MASLYDEFFEWLKGKYNANQFEISESKDKSPVVAASEIINITIK